MSLLINQCCYIYKENFKNKGIHDGINEGIGGS